MASFTFLPEGCFVFVILFMTTNTGKRRILECRCQVTLLAFDLYVAIVVAGLTLGTVTPLVTLFLVDFLMATITGQRCFLECLVFVTILALNISMFATKQ